MHKTISTILVHCLIFTPIVVLGLTISPTSQGHSGTTALPSIDSILKKNDNNALLSEPSGIANWQVHSACRDVSELGRANFTAMIIHYFDNFEDELDDSFFWTLAQVLKPYCDELKDAAVEFHLEGRKS